MVPVTDSLYLPRRAVLFVDRVESGTEALRKEPSFGATRLNTPIDAQTIRGRFTIVGRWESHSERVP